MPFIPGDTLTDTIPLVDSANTPLVGVIFTTLLTADPDGAAFTLTYTDLGTGSYRFTAPTTTSATHGNWFALVQAADAQSQVFTLQWQVQDADRPNPHYVGQELVETFALVDVSNTPITGASFTVLASRDPSGNDLGQTIDELGNGAYRVTVPAANNQQEGPHFLLLQADDALSQVIEVEWQVSPTTIISYVTPPGGMTRRELRRAVLEELGDLVITTATAATGSSQWEDVDTLADGDSTRYAGRDLYVTGGTPNNLGQIRKVQGSSSDGRLQLTRSLPESVAIGDEAEIVNTLGMGITIPRVHRAIDIAIMEAQVDVQITATIGTAFDSATRSFDIPAAFTAVDGVYANYTSDLDTQSVRKIPHAKDRGANGWWVDVANRSVYIGGLHGTLLNGATITLHGWGRPQPIAHDDDVCPVNAEWLLARVKASLLLRPIGGGRSVTPEWERQGYFYEQQAERLRDAVRPRRAPNYTKL